MSLVFVSYSRMDQDFVLQLAKDLRQNGVPIWLDQDNIPPGAQWDVAVENALDDSTHILLVLSPSSARSRNVRDEIGIAIDGNKTVLPILYKDCKVPMRVRRMQHTDFREDYDAPLKRLLDALPRVLPTGTAAEIRPRFWEALLNLSREQTTLHSSNGPVKGNVLACTAGYPGVKYGYALHRQNCSVQLAIETGDRTRNKTLFDILARKQEAIEKVLGRPLMWERMPRQKASRIKLTLETGSYRSEANWPRMQQAMITAMIALEAALQPHIDTLPPQSH